MSSRICPSFIHSRKPELEGFFTVVLKEVFEVGETLDLLVENKGSLVLVDFYFLLDRQLLVLFLFVFFRFSTLIFSLQRTGQTIIGHIFVLKLNDVLISVLPLTLYMILSLSNGLPICHSDHSRSTCHRPHSLHLCCKFVSRINNKGCCSNFRSRPGRKSGTCCLRLLSEFSCKFSWRSIIY